jgi:molecular chaperone GrpE
MLDQQALFEKFLIFLQTPPTPPDYLEAEPDETIALFEPYQMVAEWIALRHEVKQQGKLLQTSQNNLQQAFEVLKTEKEQVQKQLEVRQKQSNSTSDQKALYRDLITVVDRLDQASVHWQEQIDTMAVPPLPHPEPQGWQRWLNKLTRSQPAQSLPTISLSDVLASNQQGVDLIRRSLLDILQQRQVIPIPAQGHLFNAQTMYAVGREESASVSENTVIQEVVRGYFWGDQVLREAQVIVAAKPGVNNRSGQ